MAIIAVAGGSGGLGKAIVDGLEASGKNKVYVFTRKSSDNPKEVAVDYSNTKQLVETLEKLSIDTVISTLFIHTPEAHASQLALIEASSQSKATNRFVPSEWGTINTPKVLPFVPYAAFQIEAIETLKKTDLEFTAFVFGNLLDYWGQPHVHSHVERLNFWIDIENRVASIPGDGTQRISMLHSNDLGKFVAAAIDLPKWDEISYAHGDAIDLKEALRISEEITGEKFTVTYNPVSDLNAGKFALLDQPPNKYGLSKEEETGLFVAYSHLIVQNTMDLSDQPRLNDKIPSLKPRTFRDIVQTAWGRK